MDRPYRAALAASLGCALSAGLVVAILDAALTACDAPGDVGFAALLPAALALHAVPALAAGLIAGAVAGAVGATFGPDALGALAARLRQDRGFDRDATAALLAAGAVLALVAGLVALASLALVAGVERKGVGALLAGALVALAVPVLGAVWLPLYRLARPVARAVPRVGPVPASGVLLLGASLVTAAALATVVTSELDWRALALGGHVLLAGFLLLFALLAYLAYGPLARLRRRAPRRGALVVAACALALALVPLGLARTPSPEVAAALAEHGHGARLLVSIGRALIDRDGDGHSGFFGGPDCDDSRAAVNPDAEEVAGNGIDDNCLDGDRPAEVAARPGRSRPAAPPRRYALTRRADNLVIVAIDTLRADRLGVAGYRRDQRSLTPRMDQLAGESAYFKRAYAQAPNTPRSFPSLHASRYPSQLAFDRAFQNYPNPREDNTFLFEALQAAGLRTEGVASHFYFERAPGFSQGFDRFDNQGALDIAGSNKDVAAPRIVPRVEARLAELAASKQRFALFVHLFEPHSTYVAHDELPVTETGVPGLMQKYDYEIAFVDRWLGRILDAIDQQGLRESTMVVVLSDHGEAFGVHRVAGQKMFFHGQTLYDELLRVPLLVRIPGVTPEAIDEPVSLLDVAPTVLDALGAPIPQGMAGRTLLGRMLGQPLEPRPVFAQLLPSPSWNHKWMAMVTGDGRHKLIYRVSSRSFELYDLEQDPTEEINLYQSRPDLARRLREELVRWIEVDLAR
ncbi:MAG TPA: sulfatase-like hydrolase/transferase [Kofleriaceae bacterium]|nr:sulfatase-like hydrolase/transferase [Kofleriaceae bacterium]